MYYLIFVQKTGSDPDSHLNVRMIDKTENLEKLKAFLHQELLEALEDEAPYINEYDHPDLEYDNIDEIEKSDYLERWSDGFDFHGYYIVSDQKAAAQMAGETHMNRKEG